jgi:hypothetical protein
MYNPIGILYHYTLFVVVMLLTNILPTERFSLPDTYNYV